MKRIIKSLTAATMLAMIFAGCHRENMELQPGGSGSSSGEDAMGYIAFDGSGLVVAWSGESINSSTESDRTTRAGEPSVEDFTVEIRRVAPDNATVVTKRFGDINPDETYEAPMTIDGVQCDYQVIATYGGDMEDAAYEKPTYRGTSSVFHIEAEYNTPDNPKHVSPETILCSLESLKVSVSLEESMAELCSDASFEVKVFDPAQGLASSPYSLTFDEKTHPYGVVTLREDHTFVRFVQNPECGYFRPIADGGDAITVGVNLRYKDIDISQDIPICTAAKGNLAKPNQYRRIMLYITESDPDPGHIIINVTVETWTYNDEVVVDVFEQSSFKREPSLPNPDEDNPNAPTVGSETFNIGGTTQLSASDFPGGSYSGSATVNINTKNSQTVEHLTVHLSSSNAEFQNAYSMALDTDVDLAGSTTSAHAMLWAFGFPQANQIQGKTEVSFNLVSFLNIIQNFSGTYKLTLTVTDSAGNSSKSELTIVYGEGGSGDGPSITWPGHDFNTRYNIVDDMTVDIHIDVPDGIEHFYVTMSGSIADNLNGDLPSYFDLVEPDKYQEGLSDVLTSPIIGFPVGEDVKGKTSMIFDISKFMGMLAGVTEGHSDFTLEIVDSKNQSATATLKLNNVTE